MASVRVFIVEVWNPGLEALAFRASVRAVEEEERRVFDDPGRLGNFLAGAAVASDSGSSGTTASDTGASRPRT